MRHTLVLLCLCCLSLPFSYCKNSALKKTDDPQLSQIHLPPGFRISFWAKDVENARSLALGDKSTVFVGNRSGDKVFALRDTDGDGKADEKFTLMSGGNMPNGVAFHNGALYVAEVDKIWRFDDIENHLSQPPQRVLVFDSLPDKKHHGWKYIAFGPDGKLYVPVGAPCNNCDEAERDPRFASICRMNADGSGFEVFAHGIRNTVGFDWQPQTHELWFTDNGRDELGDNIPPDELNAAPHAGMHFGYPYCHGGDIPDPEYGKRHSCSEFTPPVAKLGPHVAALGMKFYTGKMFPDEYRNAVFIAEHGSWNRSQPIGYRITMVRMKGGQAVYETFAEGWLQNGKAWGRPVALLQLRDGSLLVSDDFANCIYRISYEGKGA
jgi:glucose/arabinose dehydrogenase